MSAFGRANRVSAIPAMLMTINSKMTASKPKDLITVLDRPQSPDYIDMISPQQKINK